MTTLHVAHSRFGAGNAPMSYGIEHGFFADVDLDVRMDLPMPRGEEVMRALGSGEADVGTGSGLPILRMAARGEQPAIVMSIENENVFAVIGAPGIERPDQLRGTTVGVCGNEDQDGIIMRRSLRTWGLELGVDVELRAFAGGRGAIFDALRAGEVSAMASTIPEPLNARAVGLPILHDYLDDHEPYQSGSVVVRRELLESDVELVQRLITAQARSIRAFRADAAGALPHVERCTPIRDPGVLRRTHELFGDAMQDFVPRPEPLLAVVRDIEMFTDETVDVDVDAIVWPEPAATVARELDR